MKKQAYLATDVALAHYCSWRVGGIAKQLYKPADVNDLADFLGKLPRDEKIVWLGLGSNVLIRDGGIKGSVILTQGCLSAIEQVDKTRVRVEAGVSCASFARHCARINLSGVEFLAGVPGTIGGALRMNAGCFSGETWDWVESVDMIDRHGVIRNRPREEFTIAYRSVEMPADEWFVAAYFRLESGDKTSSLNKIKQLLQRRADTQPTGDYNCGSVFRNPPGDYAARLIETSGLKGYQIGGAQVSTKHANFIINNGTASAADIEQLINHVQQTVAQTQGVQLQQEVHILGEPEERSV